MIGDDNETRGDSMKDRSLAARELNYPSFGGDQMGKYTEAGSCWSNFQVLFSDEKIKWAFLFSTIG